MNLATTAEMLAFGMLLLALPGTLYLALLTLSGVLPRRAQRTRPLPGQLAFVVPAHDEADIIARTIASLRAEAERDGSTDVIVVADNCHDNTAEVANTCAARVLARQNPDKRGKGHALHHAFEILRPEGHVAYIVIDADSQVAPGFIASVRARLGAGAMAVQSRYMVLNGDETPRTQLAELALAGWNVLRPRGRDRLGLSVGLLGNGFALRRTLLDRVPYTAASVVEDFEYHLALVDAGIAVRFADDAVVRGEMPTNAAAAASQRARWEGGRLQMLRRHGVRLAISSLRGDIRFINPLADLLLPPLAYLAALILGGLLAGVLAGGSLLAPLVAVQMLTVVGVHVITAIPVAGLPWRRLQLLARVPGYLFWKLLNLGSVFNSARRDATWVRTARNPSRGETSS